ncbi:MAG: hypothetical protein R3F11_13200 [Verrucomicrobiales bacterium]
MNEEKSKDGDDPDISPGALAPDGTPPASGSLLRDLRELPREFWVLFTGTFINRFGTFVMPFLAIFLKSENIRRRRRGWRFPPTGRARFSRRYRRAPGGYDRAAQHDGGRLVERGGVPDRDVLRAGAADDHGGRGRQRLLQCALPPGATAR